MSAPVAMHRRARLRRLGGNSFYRDRSERESRTLCGAPCGLFDRMWHDRAPFVAWVRDADGTRVEPCASCATHPDRMATIGGAS